jgi:hypothetical protein
MQKLEESNGIRLPDNNPSATLPQKLPAQPNPGMNAGPKQPTR